MSPSHLFLVGGRHDSSPRHSNKVMIFDADKREWREEAPLPPEAVGERGGLYDHRAVEIPTENGVAIICIGGMTGSRSYSSNLIVFDISYH